MSLIVTWILATKPKIVSLKINRIIAERAPRVARKALTSFPDIIENGSQKINLQKLKNLSFQRIDPRKFPSIDFAYFALKHEKGMPIILNAANEVAVDLFLNNKISFLNIFKLISSSLNYAVKSNMKLTSVSLKSILEFNDEAKKIALNFAPTE